MSHICKGQNLDFLVACCRLGLASSSVAPASVRAGGLAWAGPSAGKSKGYRVKLSVLDPCWPCLQLASCCPIGPSKSKGPAQSPGQVKGLPFKWGTCEFQRRGRDRRREGLGSWCAQLQTALNVKYKAVRSLGQEVTCHGVSHSVVGLSLWTPCSPWGTVMEMSI